MRITAEMYGKPGKCISCRQKFWVPKPEELPEDDNALRLADHPELLRRAGDRVRPGTHGADKNSPNAPIPPFPEVTPEIVPKDSSGRSGRMAGAPAEERPVSGMDTPSGGQMEEPTAPLDDLEPLRLLLAYQYLVEHQPRVAGSKKTAGQADTDTRLAYRRVIERARTRVEQRLRELLYDTGRRIVELLGEIAQTTLKFRVGEMDPDAYFEAVGKLRRHREWLDRQRVNLKNWLRAEDVHLLGGPGGLTLEDMDLSRVEVSLPAEDKDDRTLLKKYIDELREAFDAHSVAERRRTEWRRMVREGEVPGEALRDGPLQAAADAQRAKARIMHGRTRLHQVVKDCDTDISALQTYQQLLAKGVLPRRRGELTQEIVLAEAHTISRALADLRLWRNWASNAAVAEDPGDLPLSPPTLFRRLAEPNELRRFARESVSAYAAALCLMLLALLPVPAVKTGFLAGMVLMAVVPAFSSRARRGFFYAALWIIEAFLTGLAWRFAATGTDAQSYLANPFHLALMIAASVGAWVAMGVSATMVLRKLAGGVVWAAPAAGTAAAALLLLAVLFPTATPAPVPQPAATPMAAGAASAPTGEPAASTASKTTGPGAAEPSPSIPISIAAKPALEETPPVTAPPAVAPAKTALPAVFPAAEPVTQKNPAENAVPKEAPAESSLADGEGAEPSAAANTPSRPTGACVELRGVMRKEGSPPRFRVIVNVPGGRNRTVDLDLGDTVFGPWKALEYSAVSKKLTLSNTKRLVVLNTGETVDLPE